MFFNEKKNIFKLSALLCLSAFVASCGESDKAPSSKNAGGKYGGIYRTNDVQEIRTLDPAKINDASSHHVLHQIGELLIDLDSNLNLTSELAKSMEISQDGLTYTYHLNKGVLFHDNACFPNGKGREMKASDVKYSFDRILDVRAGAANASYFRDRVVGAADYYKSTENLPVGQEPAIKGVSGFRVVDDTTFAIELIKPFAPFKYYVVNGGCYIYPKEAVDKYGKDFFKNFVGTGPFVLERWVPQQEIVLKRNPNYWAKDEEGKPLPYLDELKWTFIKDEKQQISEFKLGNLEESYRIPTEFFKSVVDDNGNTMPEWSQFKLHRVPALSTQYYGMVTTSEVFKDKRVRQAFNFAVDRDRIIRYVLQGQAAGAAIHGLVPASMPGYDVNKIKGYSYNLEKARALLSEAGFPNGQGFPEVTLNLNAGGGRNELVAEAIQEMISKGLGIKIKMQVLEWPQHQELLESGKAPFFRLGWIADYPEPENFLNLFYGKNIPKTGPSFINSTRFNNPKFDALFEKALEELDDTKRYNLYLEAEQIAIDEAPMLWIFHDLDYRLIQPNVRNYSSNPMDRRDYKKVWLDKQK